MSLLNLITGTRQMGWRPNEPDARDHNYDMQRLGLASSDLPDEKDLSPYVSQILNQGSTSSCVANMIAGALDVAQTRAGVEFAPVSRMSIYFHARRMASRIVTDNGSSIRLAFKGMRHFGVPDEKYWPFKVSKINRRPGYQAIGMGYQRRKGEYIHIFDVGDERALAIKAAINAGYAVGFGTTIGENIQNSSGLTLVSIPRGEEKILGGHAMLIVAYRYDPVLGTIYKIMNSWGDGYKEDGYVWFTEEYVLWTFTRDIFIVRGWNRVKEAA